ncbi:MAG: VWA domain-containing protein [Myxococcales bacterium]|nr:VWA domain-containing protein [Myxococcales bacterium]
MSTAMPSFSASDPSARLIPTEGKVLPLEASELRVDAKGGLARVVFTQRFRNPYQEPLSVTYKLPLPADAAVSGFVFRIGERTIRGRVEGRSEAREQYEQAILEGRSAALLEEERSSLFTQEIGNIPPGEAVLAEIEIDQPLAWLAEGSWEWRFPLAAAPRYLGVGTIEGDVSIDVASGEIGARASLGLTIRDEVTARRSPESPSHPLVCSREQSGFAVELGSGNKAALDRDVVVRWPVAAFEPGAALDVARPSDVAQGSRAFGLLTLVPPSPDAHAEALPRDLSLLLDTSGSMSGEPLEQMKRVASALVDSLTEKDTLEMIEFSFQARAFLATPSAVTPALKKKALAWIKSLVASGGTEMVTGVRESLRSIRAGAQRQVVMITDGLVGFERDVVRAILDGLPASARFHAVGVGSAVNRSLLLPVARAGRGTEAIIGLGEDAERAVQRLLARTAAPILVDVSIEGSALREVASARLPDCYAGAPARVALELDPRGGEVVVRGRLSGAPFERRLVIPAVESGAGSAAVAKLFARERVEEIEMEMTAGRGKSHDQRIEETGKTFSIATRLTSFIAITEEATVDPRSPSRRETQPQALPFGMSAEGLGLRDGSVSTRTRAGVLPAQMISRAAPSPMAPMASASGMGGAPPPPPGFAPPGGMFGGPPPPPSPPAARAPAAPAPAKGRAARDEGAALGEKKKSAGIVERIARVFKAEEKVREAELADEAPAPAEIAAPAAAPMPGLEGRIVKVEGDLVLVEVVVPESGLVVGFDTMPAFAELTDGSRITATVDESRSTHEGSYGPGLVVRIALRLGAPPRAPLYGVQITMLSSSVLVYARV